MEKSFIAIDGDNVGNSLEYYVITNDVASLISYSERFNSTMVWIEEQLKEVFGAQIIFCGGDNLMASTNIANFSDKLLAQLRSKFEEKSGSTLSIGLGKTPQEAYFALKLAKTGGKNTIKHFRDLTNG